MKKAIKLVNNVKASSLSNALMEAYKNADEMNLAEVYTGLAAFVYGVSQSVLDSCFAKERSNAEMANKVVELAIAYAAAGAFTAAKSTHHTEDIQCVGMASRKEDDIVVVEVF